MKPASFRHFAPSSLDQAVQLLHDHAPAARALAGGQSLVPMMNFRLAHPAVLIDLNGLSELAYVRDAGTHVAIGAMTRERAIETSDTIRDHVPLLHQALKTVRDVVSQGGRVLFVGTKRQASDPIADAAKRCAQYYVNHRWLGGTLTNWQTISNSIKRLRSIEETLNTGAVGLTKKETLNLEREREKLERSLGGIKEMGGTPDLLFVIDTNKESIAIQEARKLGIPVVAVVDSNSNPEGITFPIPGNDDASRAIALYCDLVARAVIDGLSQAQGTAGVDVGASAAGPVEQLPTAH